MNSFRLSAQAPKVSGGLWREWGPFCGGDLKGVSQGLAWRCRSLERRPGPFALSLVEVEAADPGAGGAKSAATAEGVPTSAVGSPG